MAQQRKTVLQARQMGMELAAIAALVGLTEDEAKEILQHHADFSKERLP